MNSWRRSSATSHGGPRDDRHPIRDVLRGGRRRPHHRVRRVHRGARLLVDPGSDQLLRLVAGVRHAPRARSRGRLVEVDDLASGDGLELAGGIPDVDTDDDHTWIEFHVGNASLMVLARAAGDGPPAGVTHTPWGVRRRPRRAPRSRDSRCAQIRNDIWQHGPGAYDVADLEGNCWTVAQVVRRCAERNPHLHRLIGRVSRRGHGPLSSPSYGPRRRGGP